MKLCVLITQLQQLLIFCLSCFVYPFLLSLLLEDFKFQASYHFTCKYVKMYF